MKSFSILRTNVGLTTNVKIVIDSSYNLSLDSIDSDYNLSQDRYKNFKFNSGILYDDLLPVYYKNTPSEFIFKIKNDDYPDIMSSNFHNQYDNLYNYGARNIIDNKNYIEEYEYFAPLYLNVNNIPTNFIIFRIDGVSDIKISKDNFKNEILNKFKFVKLFDLTESSKLGQWLNYSFAKNLNFPKYPLEIFYDKNNFSKWSGIDVYYGGYTHKSMFLENILEVEQELFELEKFIFDGYRKLNLVYPNILNLSFLFDDTPSTPDFKRKWSLNRYYGFYLDSLDLSYTISPYRPTELKEDILIKKGNILYSVSDADNPFVEDYNKDNIYYIEYNGQFYMIESYYINRDIEISDIDYNTYLDEEYSINSQIKFKIISDLDLAGLTHSSFNKNYAYINNDGFIMKSEFEYFEISDFSDADIWLIKIDEQYFNLVYDAEVNAIKINSDYSFSFKDEYYFEYKVNSVITLVDFHVDRYNKPKKFDIFKLNFTDIKDFDTRIIDTEYSKYEYEEYDKITVTDEPKMYFDNLSSKSFPKDIDYVRYNGDIINIPVSSEYTANFETFKIESNKLSELWNINPIYCRWGYQNSLSSNDLPYLLNNSILFEDFNRSCNIFNVMPNRVDRNLDYFYTINSSTSSYIHHSLHIEDFDNKPIFDFEHYINDDYDYFTSFFERKSKFSNNIIKNVKKYSSFNSGDVNMPNSTLFRGLKFKIYDVDNIVNDGVNITNINVINNNTFEDYKFSILLTSNVSNFKWSIIEEWQMDKTYQKDDIVIFDSILYVCKKVSNIKNPVTEDNKKYTPYNSTDWVLYSNLFFWNPNKIYAQNDIIYNNDEYYYLINTSGSDDIWNPTYSYHVNDTVLYKGQYYISMTNSNYSIPPNTDVIKTISREYTNINDRVNNYWSATQSSNYKWNKVEIWNPSSQYYLNFPVVYRDMVYICNNNYIEIGDEPTISEYWTRYNKNSNVFDIIQNTDYEYKSNDIIKMNNRYYICVSNVDSETLDNGIHIYINKKWKNILVNIYVNDNTLVNLSNANRDLLYSDLYYKLTANNFISSINRISDKNDFSDYLRYTIIDEDGYVSVYKYDQNIENLPHILICDEPTLLKVKNNSLIKLPISIKANPLIKLTNNNLIDISRIDWYNNLPLAYSIKSNFNNRDIYNFNYLSIYRYNGCYMPIFYDVELFNKKYDRKNNKNYLFDSDLSYFGVMRERKFKNVNRNGSVLKFRNSKVYKSIYPMICEFGNSYSDFMIFASTWDDSYYKEIFINKNKEIVNTNDVVNVNSIGKLVELKNNSQE